MFYVRCQAAPSEARHGSVGPLQVEGAARVAVRVLVGGNVPIDRADERGVADAVGPIEGELPVHIKWPGEAFSPRFPHDAVRRAIVRPSVGIYVASVWSILVRAFRHVRVARLELQGGAAG